MSKSYLRCSTGDMVVHGTSSAKPNSTTPHVAPCMKLLPRRASKYIPPLKMSVRTYIYIYINNFSLYDLGGKKKLRPQPVSCIFLGHCGFVNTLVTDSVLWLNACCDLMDVCRSVHNLSLCISSYRASMSNLVTASRRRNRSMRVSLNLSFSSAKMGVTSLQFMVESQDSRHHSTSKQGYHEKFGSTLLAIGTLSGTSDKDGVKCIFTYTILISET